MEIRPTNFRSYNGADKIYNLSMLWVHLSPIVSSSRRKIDSCDFFVIFLLPPHFLFWGIVSRDFMANKLENIFVRAKHIFSNGHRWDASIIFLILKMFDRKFSLKTLNIFSAPRSDLSWFNRFFVIIFCISELTYYTMIRQHAPQSNLRA